MGAFDYIIPIKKDKRTKKSHISIGLLSLVYNYIYIYYVAFLLPATLLKQKMATLRRALINVHRVLSSTAVSGRSSIPALPISKTRASTLFRPEFGLVPRYFSDCSQSIEIDLSNDESKRRLFNSLLYRSKQRGYLELDLVLGKWVEEHIHSMDENGIKALLQVLDLENPDLWKWLTGQEQPPESVGVNPVFCAVHEKVMKNLNSHSAPETRSIPGKPWVRGWDDIKKGRDGPVAGNQ